MAVNIIKGENFSFSNGVINFFGERGMKSGQYWAISALNDGAMIEVDPDKTLLSEIRGCIDADVENGNGDKIAILVAAPNVAVYLFLSGTITAQHLRKAEERDGIIDIPNVLLFKRSLTVRVDSYTEYSFATADENGTIL